MHSNNAAVKCVFIDLIFTIEEYAELNGVMRLFRKSWAVLTEEQQATPSLLFSYSSVLKQVYIPREVLTAIFNRLLTKVQVVIEREPGSSEFKS
jgi:hypothetical protein